MTLWDLMDCTLPGSSGHGILQARILEWLDIPFSKDLPNPGTDPESPPLQTDSLPFEPPGKPLVIKWLDTQKKKKKIYIYIYIKS